ncbi:MAG: transaldolase [Gemmatales bacterium]|nr:MAG: transaldolase [Gemmatales bacterium]
MTSPLQSLIATGTKLWLDSIDPELVVENRKLGATGATSNPIIVADLIKTGRFDQDLVRLMNEGLDDSAVAWRMTDQLVRQAQSVFLEVWESTRGDDGYVSFELDPLIEDLELNMPHEKRVSSYIELGKKWSAGHKNRMIKVPATPAGLDAIEELCAAGVTLNVTLIFSDRQYKAARDAMWRGAQRRSSLETFKSVYSIFVSRVDVYTEKHVPQLSPRAQGQVGIVNAKRIWKQNQEFWADKKLPLKQEMIFASTGTKKKDDPPWKYVAAFAGSDIETNPPQTNDAVQKSGMTFERQIDKLPPDDVLAEIDREVDMQKLEEVLMSEGLQKFADPQKALLKLIAEKRSALKSGHAAAGVS